MTKFKLAGAMVLLAGSVVLAQDVPPPSGPGGAGMHGRGFGGPGMGGPGMGGPGMGGPGMGGPGMGGPGMAGLGMGGPGRGFGGKVVAGAPYSADVSSQSVQTLPDGNTISRSTTGRVARDGQGRTYTQETITGGFLGANGPVTVTFISDPVAGYSYVLNSRTKVATRMQKRTPPASTDNAARHGNRVERGRLGQQGGDADGLPMPQMTAPQVNDLGTQNISGVAAQGKSVTHTVPAGTMGNTLPIVSSGETWFSPDLQVLVMAKHTDPRMGQSNYSLQNIQRSEPAAALFQVPTDYTVQDGKAGPWGRGGPGGPGALKAPQE